MSRSFLTLISFLAVTTAGCKGPVTRMAANMTGDVLQVATPKLQAHWDFELFGEGLPGLILLVEGIVGVSPENEGVRTDLAKAYCLYSFGWVEDRYEIAEAEGDFEKADKIRHRAIGLYLRARDMGLEVMRQRDPGIDDALKDKEGLSRYLKREYYRKSDVDVLFWTALGWGSAINIGRDDPMLIADLATVRAIAQRALELDEEFYYAAPLALMGAIEAGLPEAMGGHPKAGRKLFERALQHTNRNSTILQVQYARTYAMVVGDRALYEKLLREAIDAPDPGDELRLSNAVAKHRAERYLANIDADL